MDMLNKIKGWLANSKNDLIIAVSFFLIAIIAFGLGRLSMLVENQRKAPLKIEHHNYQGIDVTGTSIENRNIETAKKANVAALIYVGSKNSDKYHLPDCPGALRIKEENKIWFSSKEEAENLGYGPATNCDGL